MDKGVTWPCLDKDPEARLVVAVSKKHSIFGKIVYLVIRLQFGDHVLLNTCW
jgi:hypothetical protein